MTMIMPNNDNQREEFDNFKAVQDFYKAAGVDPSRELAHNLIREEAREVFDAAVNLLKELCDLEYVVIGAAINEHLNDMPDDIKEAIEGVAHLFDMVDPKVLAEAFRRVHESNMSKLTDGELVRDPETGKILKGPNYRKPYLADLI